MASSSGSSVSNTNYNVQESIDLVASTFVRQYYTLLNKAPHLIHNFYSHHSTFIYGTIEMASEHPTEPIVGREKIRQKMEELKLNDCRAKIERIDCLKTLADGLVIQVIGELSNNGKAMRRFLQTFVLAPGSESRQDGDAQHQQQRQGNDRRGPNPNDAVNVAPKSKFFVLNSIFRYQVDGVDSESDVDATSINSSVSNVNDEQVTNKPIRTQETGPDSGQPDSTTVVQGGKQDNDTTVSKKSEADVQRLADELDNGVRLGKQQISPEGVKRDAGNVKVVANGTLDSTDKKNELSEKSTENGKSGINERSHGPTTNPASKMQPLPAATINRTQLPAEPKTWANMVRNTPSTTTQSSAPKVEPHQVVSQSTSVHTHQHHYHSQTQTQPQPQQSPQQQQQSQHPNQQQQTQQQNPQTQQPQSSQTQSATQHMHQTQNMHANRRRHMLRKGPSNKTTGRPLNKSNRPRLGPTPMGTTSTMPPATTSLSVSAVPTAAPPATTNNPQSTTAGGRPFV